MNQHPVPQHISSYEFRLVGDMTLKQFFQLAGGAVVSLIIYSSGLPEIIKWPLVLFFALSGAALAFLPFGERPLSVWVISFFKAVYSPTKYIFVKGGAEDVFSKEPPPHVPPITTVGAEPAKEEAKTQEHSAILSFEEAEKNFFQKVTALFHSTPAIQAAPQIPPEEKRPAEEITIPKIEPSRGFVPPPQPVKIPPRETPLPRPQAPRPQYFPQQVSPVFGQRTAGAPQKEAVFAPEAAPPNPPSSPNTIVGQTLTQDGKIIEAAILEIRDPNGIPVRAIKTNRVGHFMTVTPLKNGVYSVETEKEGFVFETVRVSAEGRVIPPILIRAKSTSQLVT